ncbi:hypothetical protein [Poseidonibacter ostreae]|uniref:Uncharacterized protein n=1 Tax=Poseidonibacter ostreae TaxID=2654171 RepID=A0A6L4WZK8_9BACT|nr:hypothetical protein [Poseidonibacter ostreae]KAB7891424.1 hypothetical protein GBG19_00885 [Poseidonibacter ostreae]
MSIKRFVSKEFAKAKREAKKLIEDRKVEIIDIDKKIIATRTKLIKMGKKVRTEITMNDRIMYVANNLAKGNNALGLVH